MPQVIPQFGGPVMTISSLTSTQQTKAMHQVSSANDVRTIIANHLGIDVERHPVLSGYLARHLPVYAELHARRLTA